MARMIKPEERAHGGKREGAGRKPDWLKMKCQKLIDKHELLEFVARVAAGLEEEDRVTKDGDVYKVGVSTHDRLHAFDLLMERGFGKAVQAVEHSGSVATSWQVVIEGFGEVGKP